MKTLIAIILYKLGFKPKCTTFIDEETITFGYGKIYGWTGNWEYEIPPKYLKSKHINPQ